MTQAQWIAEYIGLRKMEQEKIEVASKFFEIGGLALRRLLVGLLGLNLAKAKVGADGEEVAQEEGREEPFVPLSYLVSRPELLEAYSAQLSDEVEATHAMEDEEFEEMSKRLAKGDLGDLDPILSAKLTERFDAEAYWKSPENQAFLAAAGVKIRHTEAEAEAGAGTAAKTEAG